jgi:hypothetical protein
MSRIPNTAAKYRQKKVDIHRHCCGSGMFIPDPILIHPGSWIKQQQKRRGEKIVVSPCFVATNFTNRKLFYFSTGPEKI